MLLPFQGATAPTRDTQGVASLALGSVLHWAFSPHLLNPKLKLQGFIKYKTIKITQWKKLSPYSIKVSLFTDLQYSNGKKLDQFLS